MGCRSFKTGQTWSSVWRYNWCVTTSG